MTYIIRYKRLSKVSLRVRLINVTTTGCSENQVFLRIINPDGTFNNNVVIRDDRILNDNFCIPSTNHFVEGGIPLDGIRIYALQQKLILLTYFCKLEQGSNVAGLCGMIINWNNTIQDQFDFEHSCTDSSIVIQNIINNNGDGEFLLACYLNDFNQGLIINWSRYTVDSKNGTINIKDHGTINNINTSSQNFRNLFPTEDGGYGPFQLYKPTQSFTTLNILNILKCGISFVEFGYNCLIYLNDFNILVNIDFLDSGSIISTNEFIIFNPTSLPTVNIINVDSLYYGANTIQGLKLITNDLLSNYSSIINGNSKNNLLIFGNSFIDSVNPIIGSMINTTPGPINISITFSNLIELSNGNISIWQTSNSGDHNQDILRQSFSGDQLQYVSIDNENRTVTISVFESTFNMPGQQYYVKVDNGFVKDLRTGQDLLGIRENRWNFNTSITTQDISTGSSSSIVRLTPEGTKYFNSLSNSKKEQFSKEMSEELSKIIPVDPIRLSTSKHFQFDPNTESDQLLFRMDVKGPNNELIGVDSSINSERIARDLNILIRNKDFTGISKGDCSSMLDSTFGGISTPDLWDRYRFILIGVGVGLAILILLFYLANKSEKGRNYVVFMFTIILVDFGLDIAFIIVHGHDLKGLYPATVVILSFPILINLIATFMIVTRELKEIKPPENNNNNRTVQGSPPEKDKNFEFREWWKNHAKTALFFVLFSSIDIEGLNILSSGYSGYKRFDAPISDESAKIILIINGVVIYLVYTVIPAIIPIIAISTCSVVIVLKSTAILGYGIFCPPPRSYYRVQKIKKDKELEDLSKNGKYEPRPQHPTPPPSPFITSKRPTSVNGSLSHDVIKKTMFGRDDIDIEFQEIPIKHPIVIEPEGGRPEATTRLSEIGIVGSIGEYPIISDNSGQNQEEMEVIDSGVAGGEGSSSGYQTRMFEQFG
ncbi:5155_t:CDS:10 [Rhizophagus irregularis]|nr:5155_t:CDS:10 [Rhizophagus irregularis]